MRQACLAIAFLLAVSSIYAAAPQPSNWVVLFQDDFETAANNWQDPPTSDPNAVWQRVNDGGNTVYSGQDHITLSLVGQAWGDHRLGSRIKLLSGQLNVYYRRVALGCGGYFVSFSTNGMGLGKWNADCSVGSSQRGAGTYSAGKWYQLEIVGIGGDLKVYVDGNLTIQYTDPNPLTWGGIAFESLGSGSVEVDDVEVSGAPPQVSQSARPVIFLSSGVCRSTTLSESGSPAPTPIRSRGRPVRIATCPIVVPNSLSAPNGEASSATRRPSSATWPGLYP
jgi:hypothetical protein